MDTIWVFGDQLNRRLGALADAEPGRDRILLLESEAKLGSKGFHRQRLHLVLTAMRTFADELRRAGFEVDDRRASSYAEGLRAHRAEHRPGVVRATEPCSLAAAALLERLEVEAVRSNQFLCHRDEFSAWAEGRRRLTMEDFYRWQRRRLGYLMDGDEPVGGRWNFDAENREPPPPDADWPVPTRSRLGTRDREVLASLPASAWGAEPEGWWPTSRRSALARLRWFVQEALPHFGPHQDAMTDASWHLAHSLLSSSLNIGLLLPDEVCDAVEAAYRQGDVPIASAEGFVRQVIGWREYVWGLYWLWMPGFARANELGAERPLPPVYTGTSTRMRCVDATMTSVEANGWAHHIQRLMVLGNLGLLAGVRPTELVDWFWRSFVDGSEWVMVPNVIGMALHADGGRMATKPYAGGGAYIDRMSDYCGSCSFDPRKRVGDDACPFTSLYWDFVARHRARFATNRRMANQVSGLGRLADLPETRRRARRVLELLDAGEL